MVIIALIINIVLIVMFIQMYIHVSNMDKTIEAMNRTLTEMAKSMGCTDAGAGPAEAVPEYESESFMGYYVSPETAKNVRAFKRAGLEYQAETELRRTANMPANVARSYLEQLDK